MISICNKIIEIKMDRYSKIRSSRVCEGCLSINRSFLELDKYEIRMFYKLTDIDSKKDALQLCWECKYILRKFIKFKQQVKHAHVILNTYNHNTLPCLSNLVIKKCKDVNEIVYDDSKKTIDIEISPLTFIKVEDNENDLSFNQFDDDFILSDSDDRQLKADVKLDLENESDISREGGNNDFNESNGEVNIKHYIENESEKERDGNADDDFNESDDEPLITRKVVWKKKKERKAKNTEVKNKRETSGVINNERINKKLEKLNMASDKLQMVLLTWEEVEEERQKALESESFKRHEYRCYDCAIGFNHRCKLDNHMKKHDPCKGSEECGVCHIRCRDAHALAAHRRRHRLRWRCAQCGAAWSRAALGADHVARDHGGPQPDHRCRLCGRCEPTLAKLRNHVKDHAERPKCELCGKSFRDRTSLRTHLFIHKGEKEYECPRCNKKFLFKKAMEVHLVTHDASALLYCHLCDKNFKNKMSYNQHMKYNLKHIDPEKLKYACPQCPKRFAKASRLREHRLALHLRLAPERCAAPGCAFTCASRAVLRTHTRMQHRAGRLLRNHVCHLCGKTYTTKKCLEGHLRAHSGERPFHCAKCPAAFGYEAALYNHNKLVHLKPKSSRRAAEWLSVPQPAGEQAMET